MRRLAEVEEAGDKREGIGKKRVSNREPTWKGVIPERQEPQPTHQGRRARCQDLFCHDRPWHHPCDGLVKAQQESGTHASAPQAPPRPHHQTGKHQRQGSGSGSGDGPTLCHSRRDAWGVAGPADPTSPQQQKLSQGKLGNSYNKKIDRRVKRGAEPTVKRGVCLGAESARLAPLVSP